jgi:ABC-type multidrug transport system ATPase subunit
VAFPIVSLDGSVGLICGPSGTGKSTVARRVFGDIDAPLSNVIVETAGAEPFQEDTWVGKTLVFGDQGDGPAVTVTLRDLRCMMLNLDPDTAENDATIMKTRVRLNGNCAGVYGTVVREGPAAIGQTLWLKE